jgi:hypothetical protein
MIEMTKYFDVIIPVDGLKMVFFWCFGRFLDAFADYIIRKDFEFFEV